MSSPLLAEVDAVEADGVDLGVSAHYGDPLREQRRAVEAGAVVDRSNRGVLRVSGSDRLRWLHDLTTQHLRDLPAGEATETLVLSPHGHVEHHAVVVDDGASTWLVVEPGTAPALQAFLETMRFLLDVEVHDASADVAVLTLVGPAADAAANVALVAPRASAGWPLPRSVDLLVPRDSLAGAWGALAAIVEPAGMLALEALRVAERRPRLGLETDHRTIPHEVGWLATAVHLDKGCYRGQETVARVHNLGRPPRRMVLLHLDGSVVDLPTSGSRVLWEGVDVGFVGTVARHYELGPVALALVKRNTPDDAPLMVAGLPAAMDVAQNPAIATD